MLFPRQVGVFIGGSGERAGPALPGAPARAAIDRAREESSPTFEAPNWFPLKPVPKSLPRLTLPSFQNKSPFPFQILTGTYLATLLFSGSCLEWGRYTPWTFPARRCLTRGRADFSRLGVWLSALSLNQSKRVWDGARVTRSSPTEAQRLRWCRPCPQVRSGSHHLDPCNTCSGPKSQPPGEWR
jgi:hypothetical protein